MQLFENAKERPFKYQCHSKMDIWTNFNRANKIRNVSLSYIVMSNCTYYLWQLAKLKVLLLFLCYKNLYFSVNNMLLLFYCLPALFS